LKESFGTTIILQVFIILFVIYVAFMAVVINYSQTFRIKNQVISILEKYGGYNSTSQAKIADYFSDISIEGECAFVEETSSEYNGNRCEIAEHEGNTDTSGKYYSVVVFVKFNVPLVNMSYNFPIKGETKTLYDNVIDEDTKAPYKVTWLVTFLPLNNKLEV